jgi:Protein of unknown function (DUF5672)
MIMNRNLATILIIAHKSEITNLEAVSLSQCFKILGHYPIKLICPKGLDITCYQNVISDIDVDFIDPKWQSSYQNFSRLKIDPFIYKRYADYQFILFYELDAFVFRDELELWCSRDYDYIGAPWFKGFDEANELSAPIGIGNGGFSLRRVATALKALHRFSILDTDKPKKAWESFKLKGRPIKGFVSMIKNCTITNNSFYLFNDFSGGEDIFWGEYINRNFDWFRVASFDEALKFSFEVNAAMLFKNNNSCLPFGCHAWWRYDFNFWLPHIQNAGYLQDLPIQEI